MKPEVVSGLVNANWPVLLLDEAGVIHSANPAAAQAFGPQAAAGSAPLANFWLAENPVSPADFLAAAGSAPGVFLPIKLLGQGGISQSYQACVCSASGDGRKQFVLQLMPPSPDSRNPSAEINLAQKQKLDCALQLARTVSLDFINALTGILGHTSLVLGKLEPDSPWRHSLMEVEKSAARASEIANDLGAFSRNEKESKVQLAGNLNLLLQRNVDTFKSMKLDQEVTWALQLERKLYTAKFDEAKMQQALVKVMENAVEAIAQQGRVGIQTRNIDLTEATQDRNVHLAAGSYICAEITDTGAGIEAEVMPRVFEPFFTTKRGGKHRGLGLVFVYGVVTNHGGGVAISSQPGSGTSVRVYLPAEKEFVREREHFSGDLNGTQNILMVDDEDLLLNMGQTILTAYGYKVVTANSGVKALEILSQTDRQIDLVLTDLVMPGMSGRELVEKVRQQSPYTRILCISGYVRPSHKEGEFLLYLQKPFTARDLLIKVKAALAPVESPPVD